MNNYRVKYWRWVNPDFGEMVITGLMSLKSAKLVAESLHNYHERVEIYQDEEAAAEAAERGEG